MRSVGLVTESLTEMGPATAKELKFTPNATEFVVNYFHEVK